MSNSKKVGYVMLQAVRVNETKRNNLLNNEPTLKTYSGIVKRFCRWIKDRYGICLEQHIVQAGFTKQSLIQEYERWLEKNNKSEATIHDYLAPICKGLGVGMEEIDHPMRRADKIRKNTKRQMNARGEQQIKSGNYDRIIFVASTVGVRVSALLRLNVSCLKQEENGDYFVEVRDKLGKFSHQLIDPDKVEKLRYILTHDADGNALKAGEFPFCKKDTGSISTSRYRILFAQGMQAAYEAIFWDWKKLPLDSPEREIERIKAEKIRNDCIDRIISHRRRYDRRATEEILRRYREEICRESRIYLRGGNKENAIKWGRPLSYDRVAVYMVSVFALAHWVPSSTIKHYLNK